MTLTYRSGSAADLESLKTVGMASYGQYEAALSADGWAQLSDTLRSGSVYAELLRQGSCIVAETPEGRIVGMAFLVGRGHPTEIYDSESSYIRFVGVLPEYEGQGIGRRLMEICIEQARSQGERIVALHTSEFMHAARHLYERMGFRQTRELSPRLGKRYWLYELRLDEAQEQK